MKSKNLFLSMLLILLFGSSAFAGNPLASTGYVGKVGISFTPQLGLGMDVTTSHGYSFGNGLWMGAGAGISIASVYDGVFLPVYAESKYTFMTDKKASPFLDCKLGYITNTENLYVFLSPMAGVDINRFSIFTSYSIWSQVRVLNVGLAYNF